jgi:hypothetical protein
MNDNSMNAEIGRVLTALRPLRLMPADSERGLQDRIVAALIASGIAFEREAPLGRGRIDFLTASGVGIEVKRDRPDRGALLGQLARYAQSPRVGALVLVAERAVELPAVVGGKPCAALCLNGNWGVAL